MPAEPARAPSGACGEGGLLDVGAVFDAQAAFVHRVAQRLTGSAALADDVVQEVFLLVWSRRAELTDRAGVRTWLYRATVNVVRHRHRSDRRYADAISRLAEAPAGGMPGPDREAERLRKGQLIRTCVARLTDTQREVFVLFELEEIDGAEIAAILDIPVNTVWSRLRLARAAFSAEWRSLTGEAP